MLKLKGVYPSKDLNECSKLSAFWYGNHQSHFDSVSGKLSQPRVLNFKNHEILVKIKALKLRSFVEELVKEDFPCGVSDDGDGIDYELCLHQDFLYMQRQRNKSVNPFSP